MPGKHPCQGLVEAQSGAIGGNIQLLALDYAIILCFPNFCACHHET